jgi:hypothetical protein
MSIAVRNSTGLLNRLPAGYSYGYSNAQFDIYRILKWGLGAEHFPDRLDVRMNDQILRAQTMWFFAGWAAQAARTQGSQLGRAEDSA